MAPDRAVPLGGVADAIRTRFPAKNHCGWMVFSRRLPRRTLDSNFEVAMRGEAENDFTGKGDVFKEGEEGSNRLVVLLHGWNDTKKRMKPLHEAVARLLPDADRFVPDLPIRRFLSRTRASWLVEEVLWKLHEKAEAGTYSEIILVGHSAGAVLARAVWARAHGAQDDGSVRASEAKPWAHLIKRLVLLAGVNRGWDPHSPVNAWLRVKAWFGNIIENLAGPNFLLLDIRRGAPFLTTTRLQTLGVQRHLKETGAAIPVTVHILGTFDNLVAPADNFDFATGAGEAHYYLEVPNSGHEGVAQLDDERYGKARADAFEVALKGDRTALEASRFFILRAAIEEMAQEALNETGRPPPPASPGEAEEISKVVFIVHGIRDYGFWTKRLARKLKYGKESEGHRVHTITSSYGFFPMGPFLVPAERRKRVGWLRDQYVTARSVYPDAEFHFVGHSNGTYLLAAALRDCPAIRFKHVVFAGSVVSRQFPWHLFLPSGEKKGQVEKVLNYVATHDWVVATIPKGLQDINRLATHDRVVALIPRWLRGWYLRRSDLGSAGHSGFRETRGIVEARFVPGAHSAALASGRWKEIVNFVLNGTNPGTSPGGRSEASDEDEPRLDASQKFWARFLGWTAWAIAPAAVILVFGTGLVLLAPLGRPAELTIEWFREPVTLLTMPGWAWAFALLVYAWLVSRIVTRL